MENPAYPFFKSLLACLENAFSAQFTPAMHFFFNFFFFFFFFMQRGPLSMSETRRDYFTCLGETDFVVQWRLMNMGSYIGTIINPLAVMF